MPATDEVLALVAFPLVGIALGWSISLAFRRFAIRELVALMFFWCIAAAILGYFVWAASQESAALRMKLALTIRARLLAVVVDDDRREY